MEKLSCEKTHCLHVAVIQQQNSFKDVRPHERKIQKQKFHSQKTISDVIR